MKSKGLVDFFLGVFLEFGAAFCLLFFLPQIPWHRLPGASERVSTTPAPALSTFIPTTKRHVLLRPEQPPDFVTQLSQVAEQTRNAPALFQSRIQPVDVAPLAPPQWTHIPPQPQPPSLRRDFPRQYRY